MNKNTDRPAPCEALDALSAAGRPKRRGETEGKDLSLLRGYTGGPVSTEAGDKTCRNLK